MLVLKKLRREFLVALSQMGLKQATIRRGKNKYRIPLIHGMGRWLFLRDDGWRKKILSSLPESQTRVVLDVGLNVGQSLLDISENVKFEKYYGIEPNPACVLYVNELIRMNNLQNTVVLPYALGERKELLQLMSKGWDDASSSVVARRGNFYYTSVLSLPGDELVNDLGIDRLGLIKIDVEGFELQVLRGLKDTILQQKPVIFCEVNKRSTTKEEFFNYVTSLGYEVYAQGASRSTFLIDRLPHPNAISNDYVLVHSSNLWAQTL